MRCRDVVDGSIIYYEKQFLIVGAKDPAKLQVYTSGVISPHRNVIILDFDTYVDVVEDNE